MSLHPAAACTAALGLGFGLGLGLAPGPQLRLGRRRFEETTTVPSPHADSSLCTNVAALTPFRFRPPLLPLRRVSPDERDRRSGALD